tara:strand:+ start:1186 stop:2289 length:1104 start_codon:yes stop_codon:yes gene_type:complete
MISKKNKYVEHLLTLIILASCSTTSENLITSSNGSLPKVNLRDIQDINTYNGFFINDLEIIQQTIDNRKLNQNELREIKLLKKNYQKILKKNKYQIKLNSRQKYSNEIIELIYQFKLPISILWDENEQNVIPANLLIRKIDGFCSSLYDDSVASINKEINKIPGSILVIYSDPYASTAKKIQSANSKVFTVNYDSSNFQEFAGKILGINLSENRFKKISNLNPNQVMNFNPRSRSDITQIVMLLNPQEFKAMIPALRYHSGNKFKYINFISSLESLNNSLQLLDYEDSHSPISVYLSSRIQNEGTISIENFLEYGVLSDWLLDKVLKQAGVQSATINGATGYIYYSSNACNRREIPLQKITSNLFST